MRRLVPFVLAAAALAAAGANVGAVGAPPAPAAPPAADRPALHINAPMSSPGGLLTAGPRDNGTAVLPDGRVVTPVGTTIPVDLLPLNAVLSHDGRRLYVTSEGGDDAPDHDRVYNRFISVVDTHTLAVHRVPDDALQYGLAESPDGRHVYVSEGETDSVGVFDVDVDGSTLHRTATIKVQEGDFPWGLTITPDGRHVLVVGFRGDALSVIDTATRKVVARVGTGEYPYTVTVSSDGRRAYVSNWGLFNPMGDTVMSNVDAVTTPPLTLGGYNTDKSSSVWFYDLGSGGAQPSSTPATKVRIGRDLNGYDVVSGSLPSSLALSPDGHTLAVTSSNDDEVVLLDATTGATTRTFDLAVFAGDDGPTGAQPNALAWSEDGRLLYVAEGGRNSVAALDAKTGRVITRLPTGWYPSAVVPAGGNRLFVTSAKGLGAGPNGVNIEAPDEQQGNNPSYIGNLLKGTLQSIDLRTVCGPNVATLADAVDRNNGFIDAQHVGDTSVDPTVLPPRFGDGPSKKIKHVVFILKENRTYDQIFGDLAGTERDDRLGLFTMPVTPNHHEAATRFAHGDNYYDVGQDSFDGHFLIDSGHENEFDQKVHPTVWNANKLGPEGLYVSAPENLPIGGFMWNNLYRHGVNFRIYGEATYLLGLGPTALTPGQAPPSTQPLHPAAYALDGSYSLTYPSQITPSRPAFGDGNTDEDRADDFLRELPVLDATGQVPSFLFLWMTDDHTEGATPGRPTPEYEVARNDHALGRILEGLTRTKAWDDMAVFVTEDDPQDGQDHVDAHRTIQLVLSPYAKRGYTSPVLHSNMSTLKTIDLLLGVPPNSIQEASATSLADYFTSSPQVDPRFDARAQQVPFATNPSEAQAANATQALAARLQRDVPAGLDEGGEALQEVLRVHHEGAAAAGAPGVPVLRDEVEHRLAVGAPAPLRLARKPGGSCPLVSPSSRGGSGAGGSGRGGAGGGGSGVAGSTAAAAASVSDDAVDVDAMSASAQHGIADRASVALAAALALSCSGVAVACARRMRRRPPRTG